MLNKIYCCCEVIHISVFCFSQKCLGIEYLYENHLLKIDPQDVAQFLYKGEGLNKTAIGKIKDSTDI
jgi:hypothetical protein